MDSSEDELHFLDRFIVPHIFTFRSISGVEVLEKFRQLQFSLERRFFTPTTSNDGENLELFDKNIVELDIGVEGLLLEFVKCLEA